ncbi:MAG: DUF5618 family protein [Bacteroidales bacterium]|jgi:hypothetical protein|nr:DUF5618 family protein [Bacteroidales bacterium]
MSNIKERKSSESEKSIFNKKVKAIEKGNYTPKERQQALRELYYTEAIRYMENAKKLLVDVPIDNGHYLDTKYVRSACGIAYSGVLVALDGYSRIINYQSKSKKPRERKSIEYYQGMLSQINGKIFMDLNSAYNHLHLLGYYDGETSIKTTKIGFELAYKIINVVKPIKN